MSFILGMTISALLFNLKDCLKKKKIINPITIDTINPIISQL